MKIVGWMTCYVAVILIGMFWSAFALSTLWEWFIVPKFNAESLSLLDAYGIAVIVTFLTYHVDLDDDEKKKDRTAVERFSIYLGWTIIRPAFSLLGAWLAFRVLG